MSEIIKYIAPDATVELEVGFEKETVWLSQKQMGLLFERDYKTISKHINNAFREGELQRNSVVAKFATTADDGKVYQVEHYNLDVIISIGYRVKSVRGTQFRIWATKVLKEKLLESVTRRNSAQELVNVVKYIGRITEGKALQTEEAVGLLHVITDYSLPKAIPMTGKCW
jgi:hypothetical protein